MDERTNERRVLDAFITWASARADERREPLPTSRLRYWADLYVRRADG